MFVRVWSHIPTLRVPLNATDAASRFRSDKDHKVRPIDHYIFIDRISSSDAVPGALIKRKVKAIQH